MRDIGIDQIKDSNDCISWFCPEQTFELNGKCLAKCPEPYYHSMGKNKQNRCVLICEGGSKINNITKSCSCDQIYTYKCPFNLTSAPFGCLCQNKKYFPSKNMG